MKILNFEFSNVLKFLERWKQYNLYIQCAIVELIILFFNFHLCILNSWSWTCSLSHLNFIYLYFINWSAFQWDVGVFPGEEVAAPSPYLILAKRNVCKVTVMDVRCSHSLSLTHSKLISVIFWDSLTEFFVVQCVH